MMQSETVTPSPAGDLPGSVDVVEIGASEMLLAIVSVLILFLMASSIIKWILLFRRRVRFFGADAIVPEQPRPRPHWNAAFFVIFFGFLILANISLNMIAKAVGLTEVPAQVIAVEEINDETPAIHPVGVVVETDSNADEAQPTGAIESGTSPPAPAITVVQLLTSTTSMLAATILTMLLVLVIRPAALASPQVGHSLPAVGWLPGRGDLSLGFKAAWLILPPTMIMMGLVSLLQKYSHPVLDALKPDGPDSAPDFGIFAALFFSTAIITPLVEEFWFRGMLQGGLQRLADWSADSRRWLVTHPGNEYVTAELVMPAMESSSPTMPADDPYVSPRDIDAEALRPLAPASVADLDTRNDWTPTAVWPIIAASVVFAVMHWGQGLAPIPLFFLSCALGYLYRQTGSLVPSIIVHFVLNGFTMCITLLQLI